MILINAFTSALLQIAILTLIPFLWYVISKKRVKDFGNCIGFSFSLKSCFKLSIYLLCATYLMSMIPYFYLYFNGTISYSGFVAESFRQDRLSIQTVMVIIIWAVLHTSLSEEIFFRGFIGKNLIGKLGYLKGNIIQDLIFGFIHIPAVITAGVIPTIIIVLTTGSIGFILGWLCHKKANGSILYGWMIHAMVNIISSFMVCIFLL